MNRVDFLFVISVVWFLILFGAAAWLLLASY
jgi:hypothetical protein